MAKLPAQSELDNWKYSAALDRLAIPLIPAKGITEAYRLAAEILRKK